MAELQSLNVTDASNTARQPENQFPSTVNDGIRALEGMLARFDKDNNGSLVTGGTSTAITITLNSQHAAWFDGLRFAARITTTSGATPTINPTGSAALGAKSLYWAGSGVQVTTGDLVATAVAQFMYELTSDKVYVFGATASVAAASETVAGKAELATQAETDTGTDDARIVTPLKLTTWTPGVGTVAIVSTDKVLFADASASGILKQGLVSDITALVSTSSLVLGTAAALNATNGATFGSLPAGIKRITIMFYAVSVDDTDDLLIQIGDSGGLHTTGYVSAARADGSGHTSTAGFTISIGVAAQIITGHMTLTKASDHIWVSSHQAVHEDLSNVSVGGGYVTLDTALTQLAILDTGGDAFDGGTINILYEV